MKWRFGFLVVLLLSMLMLPLMAGAETQTGKCGENLTYTLTDGGTLTISGTGEMFDYGQTYNEAWMTTAPWGNKPVNVIIEEGVTSIGRYAFFWNRNLTSITIPNSLNNIGSSAFENCQLKTKFAHVGSNGAKTLGKYGYSFRDPENNYDLRYLYTNNEVSGLEILNVDNEVSSFSIPSNVTRIGNGAFVFNTKLNSITFSENLISIGKQAFSGCSGLTSITFPNSLITIDEAAFSQCTGLVSITLPDSVENVDEYAFCDCTNLISIAIPLPETSVSNTCFIGCLKLETVIFSDTIKEWSNKIIAGNSYNNCSWLLFDNGLLTISGTGSPSTGWKSHKEKITHVIISEGITEIPYEAFADCTNLSSISIPDSVTSIGFQAFARSGLISLTIPSNVSSIGLDAFFYCLDLKEINVSIDNTVFSSVDGVLYNKKHTELICCPAGRSGSFSIPNSVEIIGNSAFAWCTNLKGIKIPESVNTLKSMSFYYSGLSSICIPANVTNFNGGVFSGCKDLSKVVFYYNETEPLISFSLSFSNNPTIYCYEYSFIDSWATENGYSVVYLDQINTEDLLSITLQDDFRLSCGQSQPIGFNVFPEIDHISIEWISSAPSIISVESGVATAHYPGTAIITATLGDLYDSVTITSYANAESFELSSKEAWVIAKKTLQLEVTGINPSYAEISFTWSSSDTNIATVTTEGLVTTKMPGDVTISVDSNNGLHQECLIHACYPVTEIAFMETANTAYTGITLQLIANVTIRTQNCVNHLVTFTSSDDTIATVDENGVVMPLQAGTVTITATADSGVSASCMVTVKGGLSLPANLKTIEADAFAGAAIEAVIIPNGCESIGSHAFAYCPNLLYVRIPASVTSIAEDAFEGCEQVVIDRTE